MASHEDEVDKTMANVEMQAKSEDRDLVGSPSDTSREYIRGLRLYAITACLCMCLFLTNLEIPIVTTALINITTDLGGFDHVNWITSAYLLGYVVVLIIYAKMSDIFGRKSFLLLAVFIFTVFSVACGAAQTMQQFVPPAALTGAVLVFALPNGFPNHADAALQGERFSFRNYFNETLHRVDFMGCFMLLIATLFLVTALEEADTEFPWKSGFVISLLAISGVAWVLFLLWERRITSNPKRQEPVFPWRFLQNRVWLGMMLNCIFLGGTWFVTMFQIPQQYQIVKGLSPLQAGVRFIPFTIAAPVGSVIAPTIGTIFKTPLVYLVLVASIIQVVGYALFTTLPTSMHIEAAQYGYQIISGFGCGSN
ncbi:Major facilitator superfamily domain, general substrate transporter [Penicillium occitanis (nom. inval.)]|nr:Major facilitator superfamily domain, general substrate transporter [Penicillium occitanis (nom. inval.)]PCH10070.1 hypothetical protein PENOC_004730 [Penicillium occitanis (nom. inval.)]